VLKRQAEPALCDAYGDPGGRPRHLRGRRAAVGRQRVSNADDGSADLAAGLAEIGLTPKAAWYSAAVLWGVGGLLVTGLYTIDPAPFPSGVFYLGCFAIAIGGLSLFGGLRFVDASSLTEWTRGSRSS
jgi:hypothetical protein